jgi:flagellar motor protein MotB
MSSGPADGGFAHSMTDLMAGVAVTFLLIAAIFMVRSAQERQRAEQEKLRAESNAKAYEVNASKYDRIAKRDEEAISHLDELRNKLAENEVLKRTVDLEYDPRKDPRLLTIVFRREKLQFARGECKIDDPTEVQRTLREIFPQVCATVATGFVQSIALEGHTDSAPLLFGSTCGTTSPPPELRCGSSGGGGACARLGFENNVRLSAARAQNVFFEARRALAGDANVGECLDKNFLIAGRGPMDPIDGKAWDAPRSEADNTRNRRVVIRVRVAPASVSGVDGP